MTLNCESEGEAVRSLAIGQRIGKAPRIAVRVNPSFELKGSGMKMGGGAKPFGVDADKYQRWQGILSAKEPNGAGSTSSPAVRR